MELEYILEQDWGLDDYPVAMFDSEMCIAIGMVDQGIPVKEFYRGMGCKTQRPGRRLKAGLTDMGINVQDYDSRCDMR